MAAATARRTRRQHAQDEAQEQTETARTDVDTTAGEVIAEPEPAKPYAVVDVKVEMVPAYRGRIQVVTPDADGAESAEWVECPHTRYGHESEAAAQKCAKAEAARRGLRIGAA
jgi:hypothetical protein